LTSKRIIKILSFEEYNYVKNLGVREEHNKSKEKNIKPIQHKKPKQPKYTGSAT